MPSRTVALSAWALLLAVVMMRGWLQPARNSVYPIFAHAGQCWRHGEPLYEPGSATGLDRYRYGPLVAACFAPLSALPSAAGGVLWRALNALVFGAGFVCCARVLAPRLAPGWLGLLLLPLCVSSLNNAQANLLVGGCILFALAAAAQQRWWLAAAWLGVPIAFKIYPVAVALLLVLVYPLRLGSRLVVVLALTLLAPFALHEADYVTSQYASWWHTLTGAEAMVSTGAAGPRDVRVLFELAGVPLSLSAYPVVQIAAAAAAAGVVLCGRLYGWAEGRLLRAVLDLGCCWMTLFGPATESSTYTLLAPTLALAGAEAMEPRRSVWTRAVLAAILALFLGSLIVTALPQGRSYAYWLNPLAGLLLLAERTVALLSQGAQRQRNEHVESSDEANVLARATGALPVRGTGAGVRDPGRAALGRPVAAHGRP